MKKIFIITFAAAAILISTSLLFLGEKTKTELNILIPDEHYNELRAVIAKYEEKNGVKVNIMKDSYFGDIDKLVNLIYSGEESKKTVPDIFYTISDWNENVILAGIAQEIPKKEIEQTIEFTQKAVEYNGKYYGYPFVWETQAFFYNKNYVETIPNTMEELLDMSKKIEKNNTDVYGFMIPISNYFTFPIHTLFGGNEITIKNVTSPEAKAVFKKEMQFIKDNLRYNSSGYNMEVNLFKTGKLAMLFEGTWNLEGFKELDFKYGIAELPDSRMRPFMGVKSFLISSKSKNKEAASNLAKYLCSYDVQKKLMKNGTFIPVNKTLFNENLDKDYIKAISKSSEKGVLIPYLKQMEDYWNKTDMLLNDSLKDEKDISKSVDIILRR